MTRPAPRPAVFLDRDGTLIDDPGYLADPAAVRLRPGAAAALRRFAEAGWLRIIVTNQSGIGRGRFTLDAFEATQRELLRQLALEGAGIDATYHCPHTPDAGCLCRKPGTALHREAVAVWDIDITRSWCIGDRMRDVEPARELGSGAVLLAAPAPAGSEWSGLAAADLASAADLLSHYLVPA